MSTPRRPNLLLIMTDQQFADGMSCVQGTEWLHTPNMDALAASGVRFTRAYSANPLCVPPAPPCATCSTATAPTSATTPNTPGIRRRGDAGIGREAHIY